MENYQPFKPREDIHYFERDGARSYEFNPKIGELQVAMSPSSLEELVKKTGPIPEAGATVKLPLPRIPSMYSVFHGVKSISQIKRTEYECHWNPRPEADDDDTVEIPIPVMAAAPMPQRKSISDRLLGLVERIYNRKQSNGGG